MGDDAARRDDGIFDDEPMDAAEEAAGNAAGAETTGETLDERVGAVIEMLDDVRRTREGDVERLAVGDRVFAVVGADMLEMALEPSIAKAALRTPDTRPSPRGAGWIAFAPRVVDRHALDRAEAWVRLAHRRASGG